MHIGSFDVEPKSVKLIESYISENNLKDTKGEFNFMNFPFKIYHI